MLRNLLRHWLGINHLQAQLYDSDIYDADGREAHNLLAELVANLTSRVQALESSGLEDIRTMADVAQGLSELDPRRRALSDATNDYLVRKAHAEAQVRQHFGYGPPTAITFPAKDDPQQ